MTACDACLRRTDLIVAVSGSIDIAWREKQGRTSRVLARPDEDLLALGVAAACSRSSRADICALHDSPEDPSRAAWRSRAATTRSRTAAEGGACSSRSAPAAGRPTASSTSIRSSSGPERRR